MYLDLALDNVLSWGFHIYDLDKKLVQHVSISPALRSILPYKRRIILYNAFVLSGLNYSDESYANLTSSSHLQPFIVTPNNIFKLKILQLLKHRFNTRISSDIKPIATRCG